MISKIKILFFLILITVFFSLNETKAVGELTYLNIFLKGDCFLTVKSPDSKITGMDFEKGHATVAPKAVYSGLYVQTQYIIFVDPDPGSYFISIFSNSDGICELEIQLTKGGTTTFNKTLSENFKKGEIREAAFTLYRFQNYDPVHRIYDVNYQVWNIAPGSGKEALSEGFHKPYLEIIPNYIRIGTSTEENQEIPIIIRTPSCIPPSELSCSIVPAKNITFSLHDIPEEYVTFSENEFSVEANSSKVIKLKTKTPTTTNRLGGYIYVKSSIGENIIVVDFTPNERTETEPQIDLPIISFDKEKLIAKFTKLSQNTISEIDTPEEVNLPITNIKIQAASDLNEFQIIIKPLKEDEIINRNIPKIEKKTYKYIEIIKENISEKDVSNAEIEFKIDKNWIEENKIDEDKISVFKLEDSFWKVLKTNKISEDSNFVYYRASSSGLSIFVIVGEEKIPTELLPEEKAMEEKGIPMKKGPNLILSIIPIIVIFGIIIYFFWKKKKTSI